MKQNITNEQLNLYLELKTDNGIANLNFEKQEKLNKVLGIDSNRNYPPNHLINIGKMIEILEKNYQITMDGNYYEDKKWSVVLYKKTSNRFSVDFYSHKEELCDALWEVMKETL